MEDHKKLFSSARRRTQTGIALSAIAATLATTVPQSGWAQTVQPAGDESLSDPVDDSSEIVVTGSQIRGIAPAGSAVIALGEKEVEATGASSGFDVLARLPQIVNAFQGLPSPGNNNPQGAETSAVTRPNLRNIPNLNNSSGALTLVMVDGHRMVPQGIVVALVDPESVPASLIARVEALPDGASAVYGTDAVAGVINYITRDSFDGVEVTGRYGFADKYWSYDASLTAGHSWDDGGVFAAVSYSKHDWLLGRERDYIAGLDYNPLSPTFGQGATTQCDNPNVLIGNTRFYPLATPGGNIQPFTTNGGTATGGGGNRCDIIDFLSVYPKTERIGVMAGLNQQLSDRLKFDVRLWWQDRKNDYSSGPFVTSATVNRLVGGVLNPIYRPVPLMPVGSGQPAADLTANQSVRFAYSPLGNTANSRELDVNFWQVTPRFTWDINDSWQMRTLASYGESRTISRVMVIDPTLQATRLASGMINPYNIGASAAGAFDGLVRQTRRYGEFQFTDFRTIADGPLLNLPGGEIRAAVGAEYMNTDYKTRNAPGPSYQYGVLRTASQNVKSVFGELQVPIISEQNALPFLSELSLSGSLRHDDYSDFGGTTNFSVGATLAPVEWAKLRGTYGTSFTAPTPVDVLGTDQVGLVPLPITSGAVPNFPGVPAGTFPNSAIAIFLNQGVVGNLPGDPTLGPQTSKNYSFGFDIEPPFVPGLKLSATYYNLKIKDQLGFPGTGSAQSVINQAPQYIYCSNYPAVSTAAACSVPIPAALLPQFVAATDPATQVISSGGFPAFNSIAAGVLAGTIPVVYVVDGRRRNLGGAEATGIDFSARYRHDTRWGGLDASFSGNRELKRRSDTGPGTLVNDLDRCDSPLWRWSASAGGDTGGFRAQATWLHTGGYDICNPGTPGTGIIGGVTPFGQTRVKDFNTINLFFKYEFGADNSLTRDMALTLNIDNVFSQDPPFLSSGQGFSPINGITLGRYVQIGLTKKFR